MSAIPVILIVKAPNQQIDDQTILCDETWTIAKLKGHLSEVYPSKPKCNEQKIIYSGQLLNDNVILKDVLRQYEGQDTHTMHLVCTPARYSPVMKPSLVTSPGNTENIMENTDGLRQRLNASHRSDEADTSAHHQVADNDEQADHNHIAGMPFAYGNWYNYYHNGQLQQIPYGYSVGAQGDPTVMANQLMIMQQAYMQYMQQYANMMQMQADPSHTPLQQNPPVGNPPQQNIPEAPPADPPAVENDNAAGEGHPPRDWLDWLYTLSRLAVLSSVVYFYSSPVRFGMVVLLGFLLYLYQGGFFRQFVEVPLAQPANNNEQNVAANPENNPPPPPETPTPTEQPTVVNNQNHRSLFTFTWTIFTAFFSSLIPDVPNAI